jgi:hypothetical protein
MRQNLGQVDETVDLAKQVAVRGMPLQTEAVEQRLLYHRRSPIIDRISSTQQKNQRLAPQSSGVFQRNSSHTVRGLPAAISAGILRLPLPARKLPAARIKMRS